ncbi:DUF559 domain-containing protein [Baekduia soli]|uniref:DUF559 domain-containing protein n=1 Tax=Baekduia soli TaxID=496014 RepID=A0A5B8U0X0_9ACTN|nr:DUF559 domain-containing protein [Baekduia soli]QEC46637.1 DUF559 domain-containing protein [Baekduia soli]
MYAVGHVRLRIEGHWLAAVLACRSSAVLSGAEAAAAWGFGPTRAGRIDVTTPARSGRSPDARIRLHRVRSLPPDEVAVHDVIPVTTPARTLLDLAATIRGRRMEDLIARADRLERFDLLDVRRVLAAHPTRRGAPGLSRLLDRLEGRGTADLRSPAEVALLDLCDRHGLRAPIANARIEGFVVDFHWPSARLIVETDGYSFHRTPSAFDGDRDRDQVLTVAGWRVVRFSSRQLVREPSRCADRLRRLLATSGSR